MIEVKTFLTLVISHYNKTPFQPRVQVKTTVKDNLIGISKSHIFGADLLDCLIKPVH